MTRDEAAEVLSRYIDECYMEGYTEIVPGQTEAMKVALVALDNSDRWQRDSDGVYYCPICGKERGEEDWRFCPHCGAELTERR